LAVGLPLESSLVGAPPRSAGRPSPAGAAGSTSGAAGLASGSADLGAAAASASGFLPALGFSWAGYLAFSSGFFADFFYFSLTSSSFLLAAPASSSPSSGYSPAASYSFFSSVALAFFKSVDCPSPFPLLFLFFEGIPSPFLSSTSDLSLPFLASFFDFPSNYSFNASYSSYLFDSSFAHRS